MEITTGHLALLLTLAAIIVPILTALALFLLGRLFGGADKSADQYTAVLSQLSNLRLELANAERLRERELEIRLKDYVPRTEYDKQHRVTIALLRVIRQIAAQMQISAVALDADGGIGDGPG